MKHVEPAEGLGLVVVDLGGAVHGEGLWRGVGATVAVEEGHVFVDDPFVVVVEGVLERRLRREVVAVAMAVGKVVGDAKVPAVLLGGEMGALGEGEEGAETFGEELGAVDHVWLLGLRSWEW